MISGSRAAATLALATILLTASPAAAAQKTDDRQWRVLLDRASQAAEELHYVGESLWVTHEDGNTSVSTFVVQSSGNGEISVRDESRFAVLLGDDGGGLADHERNWFFPLPAADLAKAHKGLDRLATKYDVTILPGERLLNRPCIRLEITRQDDKQLVERLWVDRETGLLLRRETYQGEDKLLRMVAYLKLNLNPNGRRSTPDNARATRGQRPAQKRLHQDVTEVDEAGREALREAGWHVPEALPGDYVTEGSFAVNAGESQPLQTVYSDGLYTVSLFEQRGELAAATLPPGAEVSNDFGFPAYTWPGAVPTRVVWEAGDTTYSLVGDAPPDELRAIAAEFPRPEPDGFFERIRRGLSRLWSWVSPWS